MARRNGAEIIRKALDLDFCDTIWYGKGPNGKGPVGWWVDTLRFGGQVWYLGRTLAEALEEGRI